MGRALRTLASDVPAAFSPSQNMPGHGQWNQDVGASAPNAVVSPYVLSVRPAAAHKKRPPRPRGQTASYRYGAGFTQAVQIRQMP